MPNRQLSSSTPPAPDARVPGDPLAAFGARLRALRRERDWTLDEVAGRTGLSKGYLSRLESGDRQASIAAVLTLARLFQVSLSALLEAETAEPVVIVRGRGPAAHEAGGLAVWPLSGGSQPFRLQPLRVVVSSRRPAHEDQSHDGEEWLYVLRGKLTLVLAGDRYELGAGDAAHFNARLPHRLIAVGAEAELLLVAVPGSPRPAPLLGMAFPSSDKP